MMFRPLHKLMAISIAAQSAIVLAGPPDFGRDIRPILANSCFECHGPDESSREADLRLDTADSAQASGVILPRRPDESELIKRLISNNPDEVMPPPNSPRRPTLQQVEQLRQWIADGARYDEHWAYALLQRPTLPEVSDSAWCQTPLDHLVLAKLDSADLVPQVEAEPEVLVRRLSLALNGLPPTVEEVDKFVKQYRLDRNLAISNWVDKLLGREQFGEHFAWGWMDAARYADTNGYQSDGERVMWRWRDWLIASLNAGKPYDQMTREMLAGDLLLPESVQGWQTGDVIRDPESLDLLMATGFLRNHRYDTGSGTIPDESRFENAADRLETFSTIWLGMTMQCARCHDHKFDPIPSRDYYSLLAFFDKIPEWGMAIRKASHPFVYAPTADQRRQLAQLDKSVATSKQSLEVKEESIVAEQKRWEATLNSFDNTRTVPFDSERVPRGLTHQFLSDLPFTTDGSTTKDLGKVVNNLITGNSRWTVSCWFQATSANDATLFSNVDKPEGTYGGLLADIVGGKLRLRHVCRWVNSYVEFISTDPVQVGQWQHVTFSSDGRSQGVAYRATLNGIAESMLLVEGSTGDNIEDPLKGNLIVGGGPFLPNFVGSIADLRIYDRELSKLESAFLAERRSLSEIAAVPLADRSTIDDAFLRYHFLEQCGPPELRKLADDHHQAIEERDAFIRTLPTVMVMQEVAGRQSHIHTKGAYDQLGEPVTPMTPAILPAPVSQELDRIALADWLLQPDHPLTARVAVNRLWQQVWGRGFIDSPENFGTQSAEPLHHELLDWLATEYIRLKWDTKAILKLIVTSGAYRQRSSAPPMQWKRDPENRMLARGPRFRLPIGVIRDSSLAMAGLLQRDIGGTTVLLEPLLNQDGNEVKLSFPVNTNRRTLYTFWKRNAPHPMLAVFDVADRNQCDVRVRRTNTPLQALVTLNEPGQIACAQAFAKRIIESEQEDVARLIWAFRVATSRTPSEAQLEILRDSLSNCRAIAETEVNAWTAVANVLLNLDETMTLE
jgi:hypothetical protein